VPVARLVDAELMRQMAECVLLAVLGHLRAMDHYRAAQSAHKWQPQRPRHPAACPVGLLGLGAIGAEVARRLVANGFPVAGWSRSPKSLPGVISLTGTDGFLRLLQRSRVVVCLLPLTEATAGILDARAFAAMPAGAYLVNIARGRHVVERDLLAAIAGGHLSGAWLDVCATEPLPPDHALWNQRGITLTPHVAGLTVPESAARQVVDNWRRVSAGLEPRHRVHLDQGY